MLVSYIHVTSQINCGDVTILNQKRLSLATTVKSAIDNCFGGIEWSGHQIACKKKNNTLVTGITIFGSLVMRFANDFHSWLRHSWKLLANRLTRDPKIVIHGNSCIILYFLYNLWHLSHLVWGDYVFSSFLQPQRLRLTQWLLPLMSKPLALNLTCLEQRKYQSGEMYWMTFPDLGSRSRL